MTIFEFLLIIKQQLAKGVKDNDFSYWVEHNLAVNYEMFEKENLYIAKEMNDTIPDICEQMEPGMESIKFHKELSNEVQRLLRLVNA